MVVPRPLLPIEPPVALGALPPLPSPPRNPEFAHSYTLTTHLIPAAHPRTTSDVPLPRIPTGLSKDVRKAHVQLVADEIVAVKVRQERGEDVRPGSTRLLWTCLNRYARTDPGPRGVTLLLAHSNGAHKEVRLMRCRICRWPCVG